MSLRHPLASCLLVVLAATSLATLAAPPSRHALIEMPSRPHDDDALSNSVRRVERSNRGQVLSAERVPFDGRAVNRIKTVDDHGRVRVFMDDPQEQHPSGDQSGQQLDQSLEFDSPTHGNDD